MHDATIADDVFGHPRLAAIYDALDGDRNDLAAYVAIAEELGATSVLDVGCGTGALALDLAGRGLVVTGVDPAAASIDVARAKPGADAVRWLHGDATDLPPMQVDLVTMTANVAQAIADPGAWAATLRGARAALRPGGSLVLESRVPAERAWTAWTRDQSHRRVELDDAGPVVCWVELREVALPLVSFRWIFEFESDGEVLTSDSTLRFRSRDEIVHDIAASGLAVRDVRDAPDRPGQEYVFMATRPVDP